MLQCLYLNSKEDESDSQQDAMMFVVDYKERSLESSRDQFKQNPGFMQWTIIMLGVKSFTPKNNCKEWNLKKILIQSSEALHKGGKCLLYTDRS